MWSGNLAKHRNFQINNGFQSQLGLSNDHQKRIKTEHTSAETLTQISEHSQRNNYSRLDGLTLMKDDFREREICYTETFVMRKHRVIKCQISKTPKFWYMTLYDHKADQHYKLRLLKETGDSIFINFFQSQKAFRDHIFQDDLKRFCFSAPFSPFQRKLYFTPMQPSAIVEQFDDHDIYLRKMIANLDRDLCIYGKEEE